MFDKTGYFSAPSTNYGIQSTEKAAREWDDDALERVAQLVQACGSIENARRAVDGLRESDENERR